MVMTRLPAATASSCIARLLAKLARPDLGDVRAGQAVLDQRPHRIAVAQALGRVAHVEMGIERDQADLFQRQAEPEHAGPSHRIVAADEQASAREPDAGRDRVADRRGRLLRCVRPASIDVAAIAIPWSAARGRSRRRSGRCA